ncbi:P-loop containing nucleoside triphosphate hydrolase [Glarea lozoyensis ATCC 20868]|uniref:p-loop containing nucleoside triphosphate hydrolase n=1 Tax=Glarea lozoyensis (strain ATCC 20868 / MF5171) TaxID=1116229 RepID=S3D4M1_GLAL2|nr:P-loop containing nucleoside triphosphate hydrolase [Glarea lozoyensis ATCC 20868]EPE33392.1 P-loop containing nucleoside triphosphate hydrolase [Glarea lozoyensis ATCC 20868]
MAEVILGLSVASSVAQLIQFSQKIVSQLRELRAGDVPAAFLDIRMRLPLILNIISRIHDAQLSPGDKETFTIVVERSLKQVHQLTVILDKLTIAKGDSALRKGLKVAFGLVEESRIQNIASSLKDNVQLLTCINIAPAEKEKPLPAERRSSEAPPLYGDSTGVFSVPFIRDSQFVGREKVIRSIDEAFEKQTRVAVAGIGGVGKSQVAIEYCYQFKDNDPSAHVFWVYGGNFARFYQGYRRIAQTVALPGWDDPETNILDLVSSWFSTTSTKFLMVLDNADNIMHYWPEKYGAIDEGDGSSTNMSKHLPEIRQDHFLLITTRDTRVATRLANKGKPITLQAMSKEEATKLFLSKVDGDPHDYDKKEIDNLLHELDYLPLAISQAAAFIEENGISISEYLEALRGDDAEEFLHEELNDSRRDEQSINSVFRTWKLSFDLISQQKPRAAELLSLLAMLDRQSIPRSLLKAGGVPEVVTSLGTLQAFNLITARAGSQSFGMHRLVQRFVQISLNRSGTAQKWKDRALHCVSMTYPTEIGVAEWPLCDTLAPHVQIVTRYKYPSVEARLDLAHLICWAADFDVERGKCDQALRGAHHSLSIFQELVPPNDDRLAAATWLYGRLQYYEAKSEDDIRAATVTLKKAIANAHYPSLHYAESAFELAHLYYDQRNEKESLAMGKASFECWKEMEGTRSIRTLDNMEDYAVELAMFGHVDEAISHWQKIIDLSPSTDASENTKTIYMYRSSASISEFQGDASMAEILYKKLIELGEELYNPEHVHVLEYRLCHAEQVMRQGRLQEAIDLAKAILGVCKNQSGWQITASGLQLIAECNRLKGDFAHAKTYHYRLLELLTNMLGRGHQETVDALEAYAVCLVLNRQPKKAGPLFQEISNAREGFLDPVHADTLRALEWHGICLSRQERDAEAETKFLEIINREEKVSPRVLENLCMTLWNQQKWSELEARCRQALDLDGYDHTSARKMLSHALEQQGKIDEALECECKHKTYASDFGPLPGAASPELYPTTRRRSAPRPLTTMLIPDVTAIRTAGKGNKGIPPTMESWSSGREELFTELTRICNRVESGIVKELDKENYTRISRTELNALEEKAARVDQLLQKNSQLSSELKELQESRKHWDAVEKENERLAVELSRLEKSLQDKNLREALDVESNERTRNTTPVSSDSSIVGKIKDGEYNVVKWNKLVDKYNILCNARNEAVSSKQTLEEIFRKKKLEHEKRIGTLTKHVADRDGIIQKKRETIRKLKAQLGEVNHEGGDDEEVGNASQICTDVLPQEGLQDISLPNKEIQIPVSPSKNGPTDEAEEADHPGILPISSSRLPDDHGIGLLGQSQELPNLLGEGRFHVEDTQFEPLGPLPSSSSTEDDDSPTLHRRGQNMPSEVPPDIPDSPDSPVVVSSRSVKKRKRRDEDDVSTPPVKIKVEAITSSPSEVAPMRRLEHIESFDLDEIGQKVDTPKKHRQRDIIRQTSNLSWGSQGSGTTANHALRSSLTSTPVPRAVPIQQLHAENPQIASPLRVIDNNQRILPRTSNNLTPKPRRLASDNAVGALSEDGTIYLQSENPQPEIDATARLDNLLAKPSPPKTILSPARRNLGRQSGSNTRSTPFRSTYEKMYIPTLEPGRPIPANIRDIRNIRNSMEQPGPRSASPSTEPSHRPQSARRTRAIDIPEFPIIKSEPTSGAGQANDTPVAGHRTIATPRTKPGETRNHTPATALRSTRRLPTTSTRKQRNMRAEDDEMNPEHEPLRIRPIETLTIGDFKVNPNANQGIAYAFKDVVRGRDQRRCLQGCVKPECCGNDLRNLVLMMRDNPRRDQDVEDQRILEEFMGDNAYRIRGMNPAQREETIIQAMTRELANKYGRHRHAYQRKQSPPGFWDTDFPLTQEQQELRRMEQEKKQEAVRTRYEEAMRPGGAYIFRDEQ